MSQSERQEMVVARVQQSLKTLPIPCRVFLPEPPPWSIYCRWCGMGEDRHLLRDLLALLLAGPMSTPDGGSTEVFARALRYWSSRMQEWALSYAAGGIYPSEMVGFLAACDVARVSTIIESGRGTTAYSTRVLARYGQEAGARVISLDTARQSATVDGAECIIGNLWEYASLVRTEHPPIALLLDGPKRMEAVAFGVHVRPYVALIGQHNCLPDSEDRQAWERAYSVRYVNDHAGAFKAWEREQTRNYTDVGRSLDVSSLALCWPRSNPIPWGWQLRMWVEAERHVLGLTA